MRDAVCESALRIIGRLGERGADAEDVILGEADGGGGDRPPTAKMRKFAATIAKSKGIKPPRGYTKSATICRAFLDEHAPRRNLAQGEAANSGGGRTGAGSQRGKPRTAGGTRPGTGSPTSLRIPYGNKEVAFSMGARYGADGWYAPPGVDLSSFRERGWL